MIIEFFQTCSGLPKGYSRGYPEGDDQNWSSDFYFLLPESAPKGYVGCSFLSCKKTWEISNTYTKVSTTP